MAVVKGYVPKPTTNEFDTEIAELVAAGAPADTAVVSVIDVPIKNGSTEDDVASTVETVKRRFQIAALRSGYSAKQLEKVDNGNSVTLTLALREKITRTRKSVDVA